jgi:hypothetical protein
MVERKLLGIIPWMVTTKRHVRRTNSTDVFGTVSFQKELTDRYLFLVRIPQLITCTFFYRMFKLLCQGYRE